MVSAVRAIVLTGISTTIAIKPPNRIEGIEAARGIAATLVILYHVSRHIDAAYHTPTLRSLLQFGHAGVDCFFTISGFIILYVHYADVGRPAHLRRYIRRRFTRLMPTYWVALAITAAITAAGRHALPPPRDLIWSVTLLPSNHALIVSIAWTLRLELLFYAVFCVLILDRRAGLAVFAAWFLLVSYCALSGHRIAALPGQFTSAYNLEFFFGMAVAYVAKKYRVGSGRLIAGSGLILLAAVAMLEDAHRLNGYHDPARLAYGIPSAITLLGIIAMSRQENPTIPQIFRTLGSASYSLYLFQFIFIAIAWQAMIHAGVARLIPPLAQFAILVLAAIIGGVTTSKMIEHPLIRRVQAALAPAIVQKPLVW